MSFSPNTDFPQSGSQSMDSIDSLVAELADDFVERSQRGENPRVEDYTKQHPQIADMLRQVLPAVRLMRQSGVAANKSPQKPEVSIEEIGGTLGDYKLLREIGRGGMGVVYEAEQISLSRRVALKILPFAAAMDPRRLERFKNEAQAAAQLHHSNIVPVYAVGCERGVWYYAMQMINGHSLAELIAQLRAWNPLQHETEAPENSGAKSMLEYASDAVTLHDRSEPGSNLQPGTPAAGIETAEFAGLSTSSSNRELQFIQNAVGLGIQAATALDHAHDLDIVHRDIKPGNLMIDARGNLWVTDFGLARFRDDANVTATGDLIGTLSYMSPEQASGRRGAVDHRSDVYSLGATLYELLTLRPVYQEDNRAALLQRIVTGDPVPPRKHNPAIPIDLETIILKAMSHDMGSRYATAGDMAEDLRRYMDHRPILARRPNLAERANKWAQRHKPLVASAACFLVLLTLGLICSTFLILQERNKTQAALIDVSREYAEKETQRKRAEQERNAAETNLTLANRNFDQARKMLESFIQVAAEDLAPHPDLQDVRSRLLQESLVYYQDFIEQARDNPPLQAELAKSHQRVANILHSIGSTPAARVALEQALRTQERLAQENPTDKDLIKNLAEMYRDLGVLTDARPLKLVCHAAVQSEISATPSQIDRISALWDEYHHKHDRFCGRKCDPTEWRRLRKLACEDVIDELRTLLNAKQFNRLEEIERQQLGADILSNPKVADALGLTAVQRLKISEISEKTEHKCFKTNNGNRICMAFTNQQSKKIELLTAEQIQKWKSLLGNPCNGIIRKAVYKTMYSDDSNSSSAFLFWEFDLINGSPCSSRG